MIFHINTYITPNLLYYSRSASINPDDNFWSCIGILAEGKSHDILSVIRNSKFRLNFVVHDIICNAMNMLQQNDTTLTLLTLVIHFVTANSSIDVHYWVTKLDCEPLSRNDLNSLNFPLLSFTRILIVYSSTCSSCMALAQLKLGTSFFEVLIVDNIACDLLTLALVSLKHLPRCYILTCNFKYEVVH